MNDITERFETLAFLGVFIRLSSLLHWTDHNTLPRILSRNILPRLLGGFHSIDRESSGSGPPVRDLSFRFLPSLLLRCGTS